MTRGRRRSPWAAYGTPAVPSRARKVTLDTFVSDNSASVQATLYHMARLVLAQNAAVQSVSYALPNKHYVPFDMGYIGVENLVRCVPLAIFFVP